MGTAVYPPYYPAPRTVVYRAPSRLPGTVVPPPSHGAVPPRGLTSHRALLLDDSYSTLLNGRSVLNPGFEESVLGEESEEKRCF